jgi:hypothetical protein
MIPKCFISDYKQQHMWLLQFRQELWMCHHPIKKKARHTIQQQQDVLVHIISAWAPQPNPPAQLMLLCNLDPSNGLCNGTCMVLLDIRTMVLRCRILGGDHAGKIVFIPRMTLEPSSESLPIDLSHRWFPVHLAFIMTINKAQAQSIINIGIDLHTPVFSHGQLYVALSCCTSSHRTRVLFPEDSDTTSTTNIVYTEVLAAMINL